MLVSKSNAIEFVYGVVCGLSKYSLSEVLQLRMLRDNYYSIRVPFVELLMVITRSFILVPQFINKDNRLR